MKLFELLALVSIVLILLVIFFRKSSPDDNDFSDTSDRSAHNSIDNAAIASNSNNYRAIQGMQGVNPDDLVKVISTSSYDRLINQAANTTRRRRMVDLTMRPVENSMQTLINTWLNGSYSPVHMHKEYSEAFVILDGALAFFTFSNDGSHIDCHVISALAAPSRVNVDELTNSNSRRLRQRRSKPRSRQQNDAIATESESGHAENRVLIVEKKQYHAMAAAPKYLGWPGYAVVFETSGHTHNPAKNTKVLAPFAPRNADPANGDPNYFHTKLFPLCPPLN